MGHNKPPLPKRITGALYSQLSGLTEICKPVDADLKGINDTIGDAFLKKYSTVPGKHPKTGLEQIHIILEKPDKQKTHILSIECSDPPNAKVLNPYAAADKIDEPLWIGVAGDFEFTTKLRKYICSTTMNLREQTIFKNNEEGDESRSVIVPETFGRTSLEALFKLPSPE